MHISEGKRTAQQAAVAGAVPFHRTVPAGSNLVARAAAVHQRGELETTACLHVHRPAGLTGPKAEGEIKGWSEAGGSHKGGRE